MADLKPVGFLRCQVHRSTCQAHQAQVQAAGRLPRRSNLDAYGLPVLSDLNRHSNVRHGTAPSIGRPYPNLSTAAFSCPSGTALIHSHPQSHQNVLYLFSFRGTLNGMIREIKNEVASPVCTYLEATGRSSRRTFGDWSLGSHCVGAARSKVSCGSVSPRGNLQEAWPLAS